MHPSFLLLLAISFLRYPFTLRYPYSDTPSYSDIPSHFLLESRPYPTLPIHTYIPVHNLTHSRVKVRVRITRASTYHPTTIHTHLQVPHPRRNYPRNLSTRVPWPVCGRSGPAQVHCICCTVPYCAKRGKNQQHQQEQPHKPHSSGKQ